MISDTATVRPDNKINPDICMVCNHLKLEHGGKLTSFAKRVPGGSKFMEQLRVARLQGTLPSTKKYYACMVLDCMCKEFRN
jgi:hypothetical protein